MEQLNRNVSGLNTIYEIQLKSISSQIESIEHINSGLNRIREMYDGSVVDSSVFRNETEKMTRQLAELNQVYSRLSDDREYGLPTTGAAATTTSTTDVSAATTARLPTAISATLWLPTATTGSVYKQPNEVKKYGRNIK